MPLEQQADLLAQIRAAFPAEPIRAEGAFSDWGGTYLDARPYMAQLEGKASWEELDRTYLVIREDALSFLGTRHLVAVLPVYLRSLVEEGVWSRAKYTVIGLLTKPGPDQKTGIKRPRFEALVEALTPAQRAVIAAVLHGFAMTNALGSPGQAAGIAFVLAWQTYLPAG